MTQVRVGLLGFSAKGSWAVVGHLPYFLSDAGKAKYTITALAGSSLEAAQEAIEVYKLPPTTTAHGSPESLAADGNVDLVVVSVKTPHQYAVTKPILEAGKSVFVEWCFGNGLAESEELAALARAKGVKTMIGTQGRQASAVQTAKQLVQDGAIGRVLYTELSSTAALWGPTTDGKVTWQLQKKNGASMLEVYGGHLMECFSTVVGEFASLNATLINTVPHLAVVDPNASRSPGAPAKTVAKDTPDQILIQGTLVSGAAASIHMGSDLTADMMGTSSLWKIQGEKGRITLRNPTNGAIHVTDAEVVLEQIGVDGSVKVTETIPCPTSTYHTNIARAWDRFATGQPGVDYPTFETGVIRKRFLEAIEKSAATGQRTGYQTYL
ncbi:hypothetical protein BZG36_05465 [Bifiguratus adelaidae]|uniref:Gfo/Idh/MocA-like oxidoreductase N-terminal domain-containing protein n=1 Tax=Bifiguratus adelaidae TaxID=1938954 RepID=A0A261XTA3_9FUNG|nr:hypothetical protein BZG36_05465 [Bifiguratus adelaidae]